MSHAVGVKHCSRDCAASTLYATRAPALRTRITCAAGRLQTNATPLDASAICALCSRARVTHTRNARVMRACVTCTRARAREGGGITLRAAAPPGRGHPAPLNSKLKYFPECTFTYAPVELFTSKAL